MKNVKRKWLVLEMLVLGKCFPSVLTSWTCSSYVPSLSFSDVMPSNIRLYLVALSFSCALVSALIITRGRFPFFHLSLANASTKVGTQLPSLVNSPSWHRIAHIGQQAGLAQDCQHGPAPQAGTRLQTSASSRSWSATMNWC